MKIDSNSERKALKAEGKANLTKTTRKRRQISSAERMATIITRIECDGYCGDRAGTLYNLIQLISAGNDLPGLETLQAFFSPPDVFSCSPEKAEIERVLGQHMHAGGFADSSEEYCLT